MAASSTQLQPTGLVGYRSVTEAFPNLTQPQYQLVARVWNGQDIRFYSPGVNQLVALTLIGRKVIDCQAATCRLVLIPPTFNQIAA